jgi:hypothetical protein
MIPFDYIASHWWLWLICVAVFTAFNIVVFLSGFFAKNVKSFFVKGITMFIMGVLTAVSWLLLVGAIVIQLIQFLKKA